MMTCTKVALHGHHDERQDMNISGTTNLTAVPDNENVPSPVGDKRETMPKGGYVFGLSNASLRPVVPKGM